MRALIAAAALPVALLGVPAATADPGADGPGAAPYAAPFVDHTQWVQWGRLSSLRVYPTPSARLAARDLGTDADAAEAWAEVLATAPDAANPGMREQFWCHWQMAEFVQPGKVSWNLEPWRPVVDAGEMIASGCNPGGRQEPL
ncbi:DUF2599 domain-containing protein [Mycobacterium sp.]|uniref:DUF2599 domain-containing protein n=1 Tax=Mycobacterium sp. TaxID=1785 RepID=UPI0031D2A94F